jgi:hypothetical protein
LLLCIDSALFVPRIPLLCFVELVLLSKGVV